MIRSSLPQKVSAQLAASVAIVAGGAAYVPHTNENGVPLAALRAKVAAAVAPDEDNGAQAGADRAAETSVPALPLKAGPGASPTTVQLALGPAGEAAAGLSDVRLADPPVSAPAAPAPEAPAPVAPAAPAAPEATAPAQPPQSEDTPTGGAVGGDPSGNPPAGVDASGPRRRPSGGRNSASGRVRYACRAGPRSGR